MAALLRRRAQGASGASQCMQRAHRSRHRRNDDPGWRVVCRHRYGFRKGHLDGEMTYGEAAELQAVDGQKFYFPEMIYERASA